MVSSDESAFEKLLSELTKNVGDSCESESKEAEDVKAEESEDEEHVGGS